MADDTETQSAASVKVDKYARYRAKNRERLREKSAKWFAENGAKYRAENKEKLRAIQTKWREANREVARERAASWRAAHPERQRQSEREYRKRYPERIKAHGGAYRSKPGNKEKERLSRKVWAAHNKDRLAAKSAARRAVKLQATPRWVTDAELLPIYVEAQRKSAEIGIEYHVDHIVPLKSAIVCGLHVPWNLQILTGSENLSKNNRRWPNMP